MGQWLYWAHERGKSPLSSGGPRRDVLTGMLRGRLPPAEYEAIKMVWDPWEKIGKTLNRADMVSADEAKALRTDAFSLVVWLKKVFPRFNSSPKTHIVLFHAPDLLDRFGSVGLYGHHAIEAWNVHYKQNSNDDTA